MFKGALFLSLCVGSTALTLQVDDPVEFNKAEAPVEFSAAYRMNLVRKMQQYTFEEFIADYDKTYEKDTPEYNKRAALFYKRKAETIRLAGLSSLTWTPAMNKFLDQTKAEINTRLGYKRTKKNKGVSMARKPMEEIPANWKQAVNLDWRPNMTYSLHFQKDQGACGSCWAVSTTSALEAHADIHFGMSVPLSEQELVSCTANPHHCGGKGGCDGATAELALDYLQTQGGIVMDNQYQYTSMFGDSGTCFAEKNKNPTVMVGGYVSVPTNNQEALMYAVTKGPVVVAVDASPWSFYGGGIFSSCKQDATLNHAVVLVGYGVENRRGYWLIRNSWGADWGMNGYIKLGRDATGKDQLGTQGTNGDLNAPYCGMDYHPEEGSACEGETAPVKVCGMCGILYEPVLPIVTGVNKPSNFDTIIANVKTTKFSAEKKKMARKMQ